MSDLIDEKKFGEQVVLSFARKKQTEANTKEEEKKANPAVEALSKKATIADKKAVMKQKVINAQFYATKEMKSFEKLTSEFCDAIDKLCITKGLGSALKDLMINQILYGAIDPILKGKNPGYIPEQAFTAMRKDMYRQLISEYVDIDRDNLVKDEGEEDK